MRIIVNHLTRMQPGYICVAGINLANDQHIRPVLRERLTTDLLALNGGPFDIASVVDLGQVRYCGYHPEVEDHYFTPQNVRSEGILSREQFWKRLQGIARSSITEIFGSEIKSYKNGCVVDVNAGIASLGFLIPTDAPKLFVNSYGSIRAIVSDGTFNIDLSVTDIRLYEADHKTPKENLIMQINKRIQDHNPVILSVGLARPWRQRDDTVERHWLQVNNIHLKA